MICCLFIRSGMLVKNRSRMFDELVSVLVGSMIISFGIGHCHLRFQGGDCIAVDCWQMVMVLRCANQYQAD